VDERLAGSGAGGVGVGCGTSGQDPPEEWPTRGRVAFEDVAMRYRPGLPLVLKGCTFAVEPGQRVGIVG
jgi:ABC-type bacteriocin/lantibiotic exporter with double-glycine peptidase domain